MAVALGLLVALTYGSGDFFGGIASKRNPAAVVVAVSQAIGLVTLAVTVAVVGGDPTADDVGAGAAAGSIGLIGLLLLYRGLASGTMSVVAPLTAVGAGVVPLGWALVNGERPSSLALVGAAAALFAVVLVSAADAVDDRAATARDIALALAAGTAFGAVFILLGTTDADSGMWPVFAARAASVTIVTVAVLVVRQPIRPASGTLAAIAAAGILDVAANAFYVVATRDGLLSLVSVLSSLYPAATIVLARAVLGERMNRTQLAGIVTAIGGVVLIAAG